MGKPNGYRYGCLHQIGMFAGFILFLVVACIGLLGIEFWVELVTKLLAN